MYKTVRQGDNSLQYTILAQDDNYPITMKRRRSTRRNTAFILIVTLTLGCGIVAAAVLIPVLLTSNVVTLPARFQTFAVAATNVKGKYNIQGTQYIALLPVKDATGHFNTFQIRPSTTTITKTAKHNSTAKRVKVNDEYSASEGPVWLNNEQQHYIPLLLAAGAVCSVLVVTLPYLVFRHRNRTAAAMRTHTPISEPSKECTDSDKGTLLVEISGEED